jgi:hypothetical protein
MINAAKNNVAGSAAATKKGDPASTSDSAVGSSFDYLQTIRSPAEKGVSSNGTFGQVFTNANAIGDYVSGLLSGPKTGNQFFRDTGGQCKTPSGKIVNRWTWNNNRLGADDAAGVLGPSFAKAVSGSGLDGMIPAAAGDIASMNPLKVMNALVEPGVPDCKSFSCPVTDERSGIPKGTETHYLTPSLEFNMRGCTPATESFTPFFNAPHVPRKLVKTDNTPYIFLSVAVLSMIVLKIIS